MCVIVAVWVVVIKSSSFVVKDSHVRNLVVFLFEVEGKSSPYITLCGLHSTRSVGLILHLPGVRE